LQQLRGLIGQIKLTFCGAQSRMACRDLPVDEPVAVEKRQKRKDKILEYPRKVKNEHQLAY
jgi:hypothetical protein